MKNHSNPVSVSQRGVFFLIACAICVTPIFAFTLLSRISASSVAANPSDSEMLKDAKLVEYFCLSRVPPIIGKPSLPNEWKSALNCEIKLGDATGELTSMSSALTGRAQEIRNMAPGQFVSGRELTGNSVRHVLIYRSELNPIFYLLLIKDQSSLKGVAETGPPTSALALALLIALVCAVILTFAAPSLLRVRD